MQMKINFAYFEKNWEQSERQEASFAKSFKALDNGRAKIIGTYL